MIFGLDTTSDRLHLVLVDGAGAWGRCVEAQPGRSHSATLLPTLDELERRYIQILIKHEHRKSRVAEILGKDRTTLYRKLKELGLADGADEAI